ncbi:MAG: hypothetical protein DWQ35_14185 [Planctomycetota bacterium]|nr:MAG: hypothetical protein DWQ35_14185 [Planctomycetota bacterium]REK26962.1 MAG: hypothetical protein DWQ42_07840 [Planctomycetota bacterium]REK44318.1 MAG: hypothetical protein DWQ46_10140 [Planctomycetota bacterium]
MPRLNPLNLLLLFAYLATVSLVAWGVYRYREEARRGLASPQVQEKWQDWVDDVRTQQATEEPSDRGPVARRVPRSPIPPIYVLMEDHFVKMLISAIVTASVLFGLLVFAIRGALAPVKLPENLAANDPQEPA